METRTSWASNQPQSWRLSDLTSSSTDFPDSRTHPKSEEATGRSPRCPHTRRACCAAAIFAVATASLMCTESTRCLIVRVSLPQLLDHSLFVPVDSFSDSIEHLRGRHGQLRCISCWMWCRCDHRPAWRRARRMADFRKICNGARPGGKGTPCKCPTKSQLVSAHLTKNVG